MAMSVVAQQPFVAPFENTNKDFGTVYWEFLSTKQKEVTKLFAYGSKWISLALSSDNPTGQLAGRVSGFMGDTKNLLSTIEIPQRTVNLGKAFSNFIAEPSLETARIVALRELPNVINAISDGSDLSSKFVSYTPETILVLDTVGFTATLVGAGNGVGEQVQEIDKMTEINTEKTALHLMNIARDVSYVALAVIGLSSIFLGFAAMPWMFLACVTSALLFNTTGYFYERVVVNPDGKHMDLNKVNANLSAEIAYLRTQRA